MREALNLEEKNCNLWTSIQISQIMHAGYKIKGMVCSFGSDLASFKYKYNCANGVLKQGCTRTH